ncbi:hypothetical protein ABKN59_005896 [Abortiporus biennis]
MTYVYLLKLESVTIRLVKNKKYHQRSLEQYVIFKLDDPHLMTLWPTRQLAEEVVIVLIIHLCRHEPFSWK